MKNTEYWLLKELELADSALDNCERYSKELSRRLNNDEELQLRYEALHSDLARLSDSIWLILKEYHEFTGWQYYQLPPT